MSNSQNIKNFSNISSTELIFEENSNFQNIKILNCSNFGKVLMLDNNVMLNEKFEHEYHELLVEPSMLQIDHPKNALIVGGGDLFVAKYLSKYHLDCIDMVEIDQRVPQICQLYFRENLYPDLNNSPLKIYFEDALNFNSNKKYDFLTLDLTDPQEAADLSWDVYSQKQLLKFKSLLSDNSIMSLQVGTPFDMNQVFKNVYDILKQTFKYISCYGKYMDMYKNYQYFISCSDYYNVDNPDYAKIYQKIKQNNFQYQIYSPKYHELLLQEFKLYVLPRLNKD